MRSRGRWSRRLRFLSARFPRWSARRSSCTCCGGGPRESLWPARRCRPRGQRGSAVGIGRAAQRRAGELRLFKESIAGPTFHAGGHQLPGAARRNRGRTGPNASGKSTLLKLISGAIEPLSGRVLLDGFVSHTLAPRERARRIAMVQQESPLLFPSRAWEFVLQGRHPYGRVLRFESDDDLAIARNALAQTGAEHLSDRWMDQISG